MDNLDRLLRKQKTIIRKLKRLQKAYIQIEQGYLEEQKWILDKDEELHLLSSKLDNIINRGGLC